MGPRFSIIHDLVAEFIHLLPRAVLTTSPCQMRYGNCHMVVFRHDLFKDIRAKCIFDPKPFSTHQALFENLASMLLQQNHLCPLPLTAEPINWELDHTLRIYPLTDLLVLGDHIHAAKASFEGCVCCNPGSFVSDNTF